MKCLTLQDAELDFRRKPFTDLSSTERGLA
jgi:hypothetical protein